MTKQEFVESIRLDGEEWRDVVGREGRYIVSNHGRIATIRDCFEYKRNGQVFKKAMTPHICSTSISPSTNYRRMTFVEGGLKSTCLVHRIVAEAFIPNPRGYTCIDHIDDDPTNNRAENLQWCNYKMNNTKPHHFISASNARKGLPAPNRKAIVQLQNDNVINVFESMAEAESLGYHHSAISRVCAGKLPLYKGFKWRYLSDYESPVSMSKNS